MSCLVAVKFSTHDIVVKVDMLFCLFFFLFSPMFSLSLTHTLSLSLSLSYSGSGCVEIFREGGSFLPGIVDMTALQGRTDRQTDRRGINGIHYTRDTVGRIHGRPVVVVVIENVLFQFVKTSDGLCVEIRTEC